MSDLIRKAQLELARQKVQEKHRFFVPNGKGYEFIKALGEDKYFVTLFSAANGVGKTATSVNILANFMFPCGNKYFNQDFYKNFPYLKKGRIVSDSTTIAEAIIPEIKQWFPVDKYITAKKGKNYEYNWKTTTGFEFDLMTFNQSVKEFESVTIGWAWFDEPPPEAIYKATVSRMRRGGIIFISATPLMGSAWMYDKIYTKATLTK